MEVIMQQVNGNLFLRGVGDWTSVRDQAKRFGTALEAIGFCIQNRCKDVRFIGGNEEGEDVYLYPFGGDPATKIELKQLRRAVRENQRIRSQQRLIQARMDVLLANTKERKKRFAFKRNALGEPPEVPSSPN